MRVDRIDLVAGGQQRPDQQAPVSLDPHHDLRQVLGMGSHQRMQLSHPRQTIGDPAGDQDTAVLIQQAQVMVALAPVHPNKQHDSLLCSDILAASKGRTCGALMAVLTWHDIPPAVRPPQHRRGTRSPKNSRARMPPSAHRLVAPP